MKRNKGISMISLIIIIVVTIILIGVATTAGYRYITEGNKVKADAVVSVISDAAYRRQNDLSSGVATAYYEGYSFDVTKNIMKYKDMEGIPPDDNDGNGIPDCLEEEGAKWYLFDADSASALGIKESDRFLTRNISYIPAIEDDEVTLILVDYASGKGYLVDMPKYTIKDSIRQDGGCLNSPDGNHDYKTIATCTKPSQCIYCGMADPLTPALGHLYYAPTCTASGICSRCGELDPDNGPLGHDMIVNEDVTSPTLIEEMNKKGYKMYVNDEGTSNSTTVAAWITDALKHWHECSRCGEKSNEQVHRTGYVSVDDEYHYKMCFECGWESIQTKHTLTYRSIADNIHVKECTTCNYEVEHTDGGWVNTHMDFHYRICSEENKCHDSTVVIDGTSVEVLFKEAHKDLNYDLYCDVCNRCIDYEPPKPFGSSIQYYGKVIDTTTNSIIVEAYTEDKGTGIDYYEFGIYNPETNEVNWKEKIYITDQTAPVQYKFEDLTANTEYTIYVKATDKNGNVTEPYKIPDTRTDKLPDFAGLTNIPDEYVKGPLEIGFAPIKTDITDLKIKYSLDEGKTWTTVDIKDIETAKITLTKELENVWVKITDSADVPNETTIWKYTIEKVDATAPTVVIEAKEGDDNTELAASHTAKVTISDEKSGISPLTEIKYAWSTSNTVPPTDYKTIYTGNKEDASKVSFEVSTPDKAAGKYYLWIAEGVEDKVGNATTDPVCSKIFFEIDNNEPELSNIKMLDLAPAIEDESLFVKTNGTVTISFETDRALKEAPLVTLNGKNVAMQTQNGTLYVGAIQIPSEFDEGFLELQISGVTSSTGILSTETYTNDDLVEGPVFYDKTLPTFEYISKQ